MAMNTVAYEMFTISPVLLWMCWLIVTHYVSSVHKCGHYLCTFKILALSIWRGGGINGEQIQTKITPWYSCTQQIHLSFYFISSTQPFAMVARHCVFEREMDWEEGEKCVCVCVCVCVLVHVVAFLVCGCGWERESSSSHLHDFWPTFMTHSSNTGVFVL